MREQGIHGGTDGAPGEEDVVDQDDVPVLDVKANFGFLHYRFGTEGGEVVPVKSYVQRTDRNGCALHALNDFSQTFGKGHAAASNADQSQSFETAVFLNNFVSQPHQGAFNF